jgi:TonB-linked SusC/RagA family outer membrane protein
MNKIFTWRYCQSNYHAGVLLAILLLLFSGVGLAQQANLQTITGTVLDELDQPLPGASVQVKGTTRGMVTDIDGNFTVQAATTDTLLISFLGYEALNIPVGNQTNLNVSLYPSLETLSEVVVVGYGEQTREDLIGAVSQIGERQIEDLPIATFDQALTGQMAGVQTRTTGKPGSGPEILVRGIGSPGNNAPLYVVDGFIIGNVDNNQGDNFLLGGIAPEDIATISVLKDATAKSIYGSRASNGVVIITTKSGRKGKPTLSFDSYVGLQQIPEYEKPDVLNAQELAQFMRERIEDRIFVQDGREATIEDIPQALRNPEQYGEGTNWYDAITRDAWMQSHHIGINGGSDGLLYNVSLGYLDQEGTLISSGFTRFSLRARIDAEINKNVRFGINLAPSQTRNQNGATDPGDEQFSVFGAITSSYWADPSAPLYNFDGSLATTTQGDLTTFFTASPVARLELASDNRRTNNFLGISYLEVDVLEGLTARSSFSANLIDRGELTYTPGFLPGRNLTPNPLGTQQTSAGITNISNINWLNENTLNFKRVLNDKHSLDLLAGFTIEKRESNTTNIRANNLVDDNFEIPFFGNVSLNNVENLSGTGGGLEENSFVSLLGRAIYIYDDRYFFTGSIRQDESSRFLPESRRGVFPAASVAWRVSEESFYENSGLSRIVNDIRFEAGYGVSGNNNVANFAAQGRVADADYIFGDTPRQLKGSTVDRLPNRQLTWEETEQYDIGLDLGLLSNRFRLNIDLYRAVSTNFLTQTPVPTSSGFNQIINNGGKFENKGIEIEFNTQDLVRTSDFSYDLGLNFTRNVNEVLEIENAALFRGSAGNGTSFSITREGDPVGLYYGLQSLGLFTAEQIGDPSVPKYPNAIVGNFNYLDGDGDGNLEQFEDYVVIGNPHPDFIFGLNHNLRYKNFDLRVLMNGAVGQQVYELRREIMFNLDGVFNLDASVKDRYRPGDDPATKTIPISVNNTDRFRWPNSNYVYDASYLLVRNLTLGYTLNKSFLGNKLKKGRAYLSIQNPLLFSEYDRGFPEINRAADGSLVRNVNQGSYPISRIYTLGLNVSF